MAKGRTQAYLLDFVLQHFQDSVAVIDFPDILPLAFPLLHLVVAVVGVCLLIGLMRWHSWMNKFVCEWLPLSLSSPRMRSVSLFYFPRFGLSPPQFHQVSPFSARSFGGLFIEQQWIERPLKEA